MIDEAMRFRLAMLQQPTRERGLFCRQRPIGYIFTRGFHDLTSIRWNYSAFFYGIIPYIPLAC
jgi:hypothetical protein